MAFLRAVVLYEVRYAAGGTNTAEDCRVSAFAALGILMVLTATTKKFIAPHFVDVQHGLRQLNDWSAHNCLGPKP